MTALDRLATLLQAEGGLLSAAVTGVAAATPDDTAGASRTPLAVAADFGRRAAGGTDATTAGDYALLVEAIREGYLQHYGEGRVLRTSDADLALLAGDRLYALGLSRLAELGDLTAIRVLADLISRCAQAHAEGRPAEADAAWDVAVATLARTASR